MEEKKNTLTPRKVDICICIKNRGLIVDSIVKCLDKITANIDCNVIFIDGLSSDSTIDKLIEYFNNHKDNCTIRQLGENNSNYIAAYNEALKLVVSEYVCWLDSDDLCSDNKLVEQAKFLDEHKDVDVVSCSTYFMDNQVLVNSLMELDNDKIVEALENGASMKEICHFQSCMFRKKCLKKFKNDTWFYPEFIGGYAGEAFLYLLHFNGFKFANIPNEYYIYTKGKYKGSLTNTIMPLYSNEIANLTYAGKKKELMKLFRKYNKKQEE